MLEEGKLTMELAHEFVKLGLRFDGERLAAEALALPDSAWVAHPSRFDGNGAVLLISVEGTINHDFALAGPMGATPHLERCPYLRQVLASFGAPISRSRLMRLDPGAEVPPHADVNYHWFRRTRIHVPVVTNPEVVFFCGDASVHMQAGEAWIFDNFRLHSVVNRSSKARIHLVADTRGSPEFWSLAEQREPREIPFHASAHPELALEPYLFEVLTPDEVEELLSRVIRDLESLDEGASAAALFSPFAADFCRSWRELFSRHGHAKEGLPEYARAIEAAGAAAFRLGLRDSLPPDGAGMKALTVLGKMFVMNNQMA